MLLVWPTLHAEVQLGIDTLESMHFAPIAGKRIGILTHAAGVNARGQPTVDVIVQSKTCRVLALFGPEHGMRGTVAAEKYVENSVDQKTGIPVYSLYGKTRRPTDAMLRGLDAVVIDLQTVGVRSYTYISCMRYMMEACFEKKIEVIVLDRPNPLGGLKVDGPPMDPEWVSYVGAFHIPYVYGLTIGELALMSVRDPSIVPQDARKYLNAKGKLTVIPMRGWTRKMLWPDTGLAWVPTSPQISSFAAVIGYTTSGLGSQLGGFRIGIGTNQPFRLLSYDGQTGKTLQHSLATFHIPGIEFRPVQINQSGKIIDGVYFEIIDWNAFKPSRLSVHMLQLALRWQHPHNPFLNAKPGASGLFNKHFGSNSFWHALCDKHAALNASKFFTQWDAYCRQFAERAQKYWIYSL